MGERYKVSVLNGVSADALSETSNVQSTSKYHADTKIALGDVSNDKDEEYLYVVGYGDITVPHTAKNGGDIETLAFINLTGCVHFASKAKDKDSGVAVPAGGPIHASPYSGIADIDASAANNVKFGDGSKTKGAGSIVDFDKADNAKLAVASAHDGLFGLNIVKEVVVKDRHFNYASNDKARFFWTSCIMDQVPDDSKFYMAMSFETHQEHESMVSGTDLTNTVPLHLNLKFSGDNHVQEKINTGDIITSFINYDCVLRISPDGNVITSN
jgi:hypothetical protein